MMKVILIGDYVGNRNRGIFNRGLAGIGRAFLLSMKGETS